MSDLTPPPPPPPPAPQSAAMPGSRTGGQLGLRRSVGLTILLTFVTVGLWMFWWAYKNGDELKRYTGDGLGGLAYLLITILFYPVTMFLMAGEVERLYRSEQREPPVTSMTGLWFLLPVLGNIIWYLKVQNALNAFWAGKGQHLSPGV